MCVKFAGLSFLHSCILQLSIHHKPNKNTRETQPQQPQHAQGTQQTLKFPATTPIINKVNTFGLYRTIVRPRGRPFRHSTKGRPPIRAVIVRCSFGVHFVFIWCSFGVCAKNIKTGKKEIQKTPRTSKKDNATHQ